MFVGFVFFKQKTAYEMRISDWSSDVCSSDLTTPAKMHRQRLKSSSMTTLLFSHPACEDHIPDLGHPENPGRLRAIAQALADGEFGALLRREVPRAEDDQIARVHPRRFVPELLANVAADGDHQIGSAHVRTPVTNSHLEYT